MMNKETRKLAKIPEEAREEISSYFVEYPPVVDEDSKKFPKLNESTAGSIRTGLTVSRVCSMLVNYFVPYKNHIFFIIAWKFPFFMCSQDGMIWMWTNMWIMWNMLVGFLRWIVISSPFPFTLANVAFWCPLFEREDIECIFFAYLVHLN